MRKIQIAKNLGNCKNAVTTLMLAGVLVFLLPGLSRSQGGYELIWGEVGVSGQSSGGGYKQEGSVLVTDGNEMTGAGYTMTEEPVEPSDYCIISFPDFARFADYWLDTSCDDVNYWCNGADLDQTGEVDILDLKTFTDMWLNYCPADSVFY